MLQSQAGMAARWPPGVEDAEAVPRAEKFLPFAVLAVQKERQACLREPQVGPCQADLAGQQEYRAQAAAPPMQAMLLLLLLTVVTHQELAVHHVRQVGYPACLGPAAACQGLWAAVRHVRLRRGELRAALPGLVQSLEVRLQALKHYVACQGAACQAAAAMEPLAPTSSAEAGWLEAAAVNVGGRQAA